MPTVDQVSRPRHAKAPMREGGDTVDMLSGEACDGSKPVRQGLSAVSAVDNAGTFLICIYLDMHTE